MSLATASVAAPAFAGPQWLGWPLEFWFFGGVLAGVALFHRHTLRLAVGGLLLLALYKVAWSPFAGGPGWAGLMQHLGHEAVTLANLLLLLLGFALLARHVEDSGLPARLPRWLPDDWTGGLCLLGLIFVLSAFLDNIAAAMIGGAIAHSVFAGRVHVAYLVAIVAAANAGGAGSVVGDTTTTMMWLAGVPAAEVLPATLAAAVALAVCGIPASIQQQAFSPIRRDAPAGLQVDGVRLMIVLAMLGAAVATNVVVSLHFSAWADRFPFLGCSVWVALLLGSPWRRPAWSLLPAAGLGAAFLLSLVLCASMMPVERLPAASWASTLGLGFLSAVFDNIPLTALALKQGGYDWAFLAYAVGFGGSMMWFGSSAGVALAGMYPQARSVREWLRKGWYVVPAYLIGFAVMLGLLGYRPGTLLAGHG